MVRHLSIPAALSLDVMDKITKMVQVDFMTAAGPTPTTFGNLTGKTSFAVASIFCLKKNINRGCSVSWNQGYSNV